MTTTTVSEFHESQITSYLKFASTKRNEALREIEVSFRESEDSAIDGKDSSKLYTAEEVRAIVEGIKTAVKGDVQRELIHTAHTTALVLRQLFSQAEEVFFFFSFTHTPKIEKTKQILLDLHVDASNLENEFLLKEVASLDPTIQQPQGGKLKPVSKTTSSSAVQHVLDKKARTEDRFKQLQAQCTEILRKKTAITEELERAKEEIAKLKTTVGKTTTSASTTTTTTTEGEKMKMKITELTMANQTAQKQIAEERAKTTKVEAELLKKVQQTGPFQNMRRMIKQKNEDIRALHELLKKHAPSVPLPSDITTGDVKEIDDTDD